MVSPHDDSIELVSSRYEAWREQFEAERRRLEDVLASRDLESSVERIEHVGSTAVPDLAAKDIVDLDIVVADDAVAEVSRAIANELGGDRYENADTWQPVFREHDGQRFNDHVFAVSTGKWKVSVVTRDVLRQHSDVREEYEIVKRDLAADHDDLGAYSRGKTDLVERVLRIARESEGVSFNFEVPADP